MEFEFQYEKGKNRDPRIFRFHILSTFKFSFLRPTVCRFENAWNIQKAKDLMVSLAKPANFSQTKLLVSLDSLRPTVSKQDVLDLQDSNLFSQFKRE